MFNIRLLLATIALGFGFTNTILAEVTGRVVSNVLNIRQDPSTSSRVLGQVKAGDELTILRAGNGWLEIVVPEQVKVYISEAYIKSGKTTSRLNVRLGAGTQHPSLGLVDAGTTVKQVGEASSGWVQIVPPTALRAYVASRLVNANTSNLPDLNIVEAPSEATTKGKVVPIESSLKIESNPFPDLPISEGSGKHASIKGILYPVDPVVNVKYALAVETNGRYEVSCFVHTGGSNKFEQFSTKTVQLTGILYEVKNWDKPVMKVSRITPFK